jgi:hypothetical protein
MTCGLILARRRSRLSDGQANWHARESGSLNVILHYINRCSFPFFS